MQTLEPILAQQPFLQNLDPEHLQLLVGCASNIRYEAGQFLLREGEEANEFFMSAIHINNARYLTGIYVGK